jgi:23S rRNA U2552 (ribose-2'-O)-methylase RlmE/FtsJ
MMDIVSWYTRDIKATQLIRPKEYIDSKLKEEITQLKDQLGKIPPKVLYSARMRYDGYKIRGIPRGVVKMANLDAVFKLTKEIRTFGDLCGGPGGFVEFILFKNKNCIGYGMTLTSDNYVVDSTRFSAIKGPNGDGDILKKENRNDFPKNLDFVIADGGLDVSGRENAQEFLHLNLYSAQIICALQCLKTGGTFVIKFFDTHTSSSVNLLYALSTCFQKMCIYKPVSSRAANSERYVICKQKFADVTFQIDTLEEVQHLIPNLINQKFYNYICGRNNSLATLQLSGLRRLILFSKRPNLSCRPIFRTQWSLDKFLFTIQTCRRQLPKLRSQ